MNVSNIASAQSPAQEAMETTAQTKAEAAKGDRQAAQKLARIQAANNAQTAPPPAESSAETAKAKLNAKA